MDRDKKLEKIAKEIENCKTCKVGKVGKAVPGEGSASAKVVFIGEAPGKTEAETGRPFVGRSGRFLRSLIREAGLLEKDVYITSPVKYLPKRGTPTLSDIKHGREHLEKQFEIINPKIIVLLGKTAVRAVLDEDLPININHGKIIERDGKKYLITFHPAAAVRFLKNKKPLLEDFKKLKTIV